MVTVKRRRGVFPGSFNPLTVAHLEIARLARDRYSLDEVQLLVSHVALDKTNPPGPPFAERIAVLKAEASDYPWLTVDTTDQQLIADMARDFDVVIMGADKWIQVNNVAYYDSLSARDAALASLPTVVVAQRGDFGIDGDNANVLVTPTELHDVSSSKARDGAHHLMAPQSRKRWRLS